MEYVRPLTLILIFLTYGEMSSEVYRCPSHLPRNSYLKTYRDQCYYFVNQERYWSAARDHCYHWGRGHHVIIRDQGTQDFVMRSLQQLGWNKNGLWIGAHDLDAEGDWKWVTGHPLTYTNWDSDQPGGCFLVFCHEDCANLRLANGKWHDYPCDSLDYVYTYVCQYTMGPPTTSTSTTTTTTTTTPTPTTTTGTTTTPTSTTTRVVQSTTTTHDKTTTEHHSPSNTTTEDTFVQTPNSERQKAVFHFEAVIPMALSVLLAILFIVGSILLLRKQRKRTAGSKRYYNATYGVAFEALPRPNKFVNEENTIRCEQKVTNINGTSQMSYINDCSGTSQMDNICGSMAGKSQMGNICRSMAETSQMSNINVCIAGKSQACEEHKDKLDPNDDKDDKIYNISESVYHEIDNVKSTKQGVKIGTLTNDHLYKSVGYNNNLYSQSEA